MVITTAWTPSWIALTISLSVLLILLVFLLVWLCWYREHDKGTQYYMLNEDGLKPVATGEDEFDENGNGFFRRFSSSGVLRPNFRLTGSSLAMTPKANVSHAEVNDLLDSLDFDKQFANAVLQIEIGEAKTFVETDDWKSCISSSNLPTRRNSEVDSYASAMSDPGYINIV